MNQETVNPELFRRNRARFAREMREDSIAVFCSNDLVGSNGETHRRYRQNPDLYYLSGVAQPETVLVLAPGTAKQGFAEVLFVRRSDRRTGLRRGPGLTLASAAQMSGVAQVLYLDELDAVLHELILLASRVYVNSREDRHAYSEAAAPDIRFAERLMKLYPAHKYHRAQPILKKIGMVKSAVEVDLVARALELADVGLRAAREHVRVGVAEHVLEASCIQAIVAGGAQGLAHPVRVASGDNSLYPGYDANAATLPAGTLVQLHVGVVYAGYHASVARVLPVDGAFSKRQRQVYRAVETALRAGTEALVPGTTLPECEHDLAERLRASCSELGIAGASAGQHYTTSAYHHVGRNLRDPYLPYAPLQSGMTVACEPAIWLPEEGFGIQLRNVILVTDQGPVDLCAAISLDLDAVETVAYAAG